MNALSLYVTSCRMVFQADINNAGAWNDINRLIMYLRQSLTCIVCGQLLKVPMSSSVASCQHHVCKSCIGGKMRLKPSCSWCKDYSKFIENIQLRILLQCYKRLALYIKRSEISKKWANLETGNTSGVLIGSSANSNQNNCPSNFKDLIDEGINIQDKYTFFEPPSLRNLNKSTNSSINQATNSTTLSTSTNISDHKSIQGNLISNIRILDMQDDHSIKTQATIMRLRAPSDTSSIGGQLISNSIHNHQLNNQTNSLLNSSSLNHSINQSTTTNITPTKTKQHKIRKGCRCGLATRNPGGKLTCCGQRCPCYVEGKACLDCKCRGCRNPHKNRLNNSNDKNSQANSINSNLMNRTSPSISISTNNLITNTSPNLFVSSSLSNSLQLNSSHNQNSNLLSPSLSPSFLLSSSSTSKTLNNANHMLFQNGAKINISSSSNSSPSAAILLSTQNNVSGNVSGVDSLTLPFPSIENMEDQVICIEEDSTLNHQSIIDT